MLGSPRRARALDPRALRRLSLAHGAARRRPRSWSRSGALCYAAHLLLVACLAVGAAVFLACFVALRRAFQRASGGLSFRVRWPPGLSAAAELGGAPGAQPARATSAALTTGAGLVFASSSAASIIRWRSVRVPSALFSFSARARGTSAPGSGPSGAGFEQLADGHGLGLPGAVPDDLGRVERSSLAIARFRARSGEANPVGMCEGLHVLRASAPGGTARPAEQGPSRQLPFPLLPSRGIEIDWISLSYRSPGLGPSGGAGASVPLSSPPCPGGVRCAGKLCECRAGVNPTAIVRPQSFAKSIFFRADPCSRFGQVETPPVGLGRPVSERSGARGGTSGYPKTWIRDWS